MLTSTPRRSGSRCGRPPGCWRPPGGPARRSGPGSPARRAGTATAVATAKFWAADAGHRVAHTAVHVHGGLGIDTSYPVHRYFTAAKHNEFTLGGATAQLRRIGAVLARAPSVP